MDIRVRVWGALSERERLALTAARRLDGREFRALRRNVRRIIDRVRRDGDEGLRYFARKFDRLAPPRDGLPFADHIRVGAAARRRAIDRVPSSVKRALDLAIDNARRVQSAFHSTQAVEVNDISGLAIRGGWHPISSAGLYVPHGRGRFPSMMVMLGVPATCADVKRIVVMTPPDSDGNVDPATLYVADRVGISDMYKIGGAQAIAAMAYGSESIAAVDKIFGPGSLYVTMARHLLREVVDCGMPAGPSESVIIADEHADPEICAVDLLIEAEHGSDSMAFLIASDVRLIEEVRRGVARELAHIPVSRREYIQNVLCSYGGIIQSANLAESIEIANRFAPEHLKIDTLRPREVARQITAAGEILLGAHSAFSIANYLTGANSILPTNRHARSWSAISIADFCVHRAQIEVTQDGYAQLARHAIALAEYEGFYAHAHALKFRNANTR